MHGRRCRVHCYAGEHRVRHVAVEPRHVSVELQQHQSVFYVSSGVPNQWLVREWQGQPYIFAAPAPMMYAPPLPLSLAPLATDAVAAAAVGFLSAQR